MYVACSMKTDLVLGERDKITIPVLIDLSLLRMTGKIYMNKILINRVTSILTLNGYRPNKWSFKMYDSKADRTN